jgi:serine/threonine protein kinase
MVEDDPDRTRVAVVDPLVGAVLDRRYRIEFRLAAGGFGAIYRAVHVISRRAVALKVLHTNLARDPEVVARFRREAAALGQLRSPHTIKAYDFGETKDGLLYIAMELLQGESLYERYAALGPLPWRRLVAIARQVCSALAEAHALGIVHRDLKPTNIHLEYIDGNPDYVKVLDFGIAKILLGSTLDNADLTRSGHMIGTFDYMAPEQMVGGQTSGQSDIYTLGIVMYEMLTGERPAIPKRQRRCSPRCCRPRRRRRRRSPARRLRSTRSSRVASTASATRAIAMSSSWPTTSIACWSSYPTSPIG